MALTPDVDGTGSGSLLDSVLSTLFRKRSLPGSSIHGIFWATVLEWGAIARLQ